MVANTVMGLVGMSGFKDQRLQRRLEILTRCLEESPSQSFPEVFDEPASLEACYRFVNNVKVSLAAILVGHYEEVSQRVATEEEVLVVHDTTHFFYGVDSNRRGLGRSRKADNTFFAHVSLVLSNQGYRRPLGVVAVQTYVRDDQTTNEFARWGVGVSTSRQRLGSTSAIHVMDREGDDYALMCQLVDQREGFVIRARHNRVLEDDHSTTRLFDVTQTLECSVERDATLNKRTDGERPPAAKKKHPVRQAREVQLALGATTVTLRRPERTSTSLPMSIEVNVVRVWEPEPPLGEIPIEWTLLTSERIHTAQALERIVDIYRTRWTIEEYFKSLKTGCAMEKRQLLDYESLCNTLGIFIPIACRALALRSAAHDAPEQPTQLELDEDEMTILRLQKPKYLSNEPTAQEVLLAVASMGGHIKWNGAPGWLTIIRGVQKLALLTTGWRLAKFQPDRDQS
jgi:hypothetical protein